MPNDETLNEELTREQKDLLTKFLKRYCTTRFRPHALVNGHFKGFTQVPRYFDKLVRLQKGKFWVIDNDKNTPHYKIALLSVIRFPNAADETLYNAKLRIWTNKQGDC
ncbi:MAG: hypothetical protein NC132_06675 [Corallococcus sp.]|nr:hypothetical protein [Corallococcus sp.]MCM1360170.1 hypothetical protein [Corallococcus sp.]MCM1395767.1 hypothetical protein [Corallococcus sp.]